MKRSPERESDRRDIRFRTALLTLLPVPLLLASAWLLNRPSIASEPAAVKDRGSEVSQFVADDDSLVLDLSKKETFVKLAVNAKPQEVWITDIQVKHLPTEYQLVPKSGSTGFGHPLDVQLVKPANVRIRLSLVKRGKDLALRVSPQIVLSKSNTIDLTQDRLTRTARSLRRRIKNLDQQIRSMARERRDIDLWLHAPGNKPLAAVRVARHRIKLLDQAMKTRRLDIPVAQSQCAALQSVGELMAQLHKNVEIHYRVEIKQTVEGQLPEPPEPFPPNTAVRQRMQKANTERAGRPTRM